MIASNARSGPVPLPLGVRVMLGEMVVLSRGWGFRGMGPALAGKLGRFSLGASRQSQGVRFQSSLRTHPAPPAYVLLEMGPALAGW